MKTSKNIGAHVSPHTIHLRNWRSARASSAGRSTGTDARSHAIRAGARTSESDDHGPRGDDADGADDDDDEDEDDDEDDDDDDTDAAADADT